MDRSSATGSRILDGGRPPVTASAAANRRRVVTGERPPSYVSKATLAAELDISETTVDSWVERGLLPPPIRRGGSVRWCWAEVVAWMTPQAALVSDPFMAALNNVS